MRSVHELDLVWAYRKEQQDNGKTQCEKQEFAWKQEFARMEEAQIQDLWRGEGPGLRIGWRALGMEGVVKVKVPQLCLTLCDPMSRLYSPWNSPGHNTGVGSLSLLQGIFPTQGLNSGLPHCRWILYQLSHKGSPRILEWVAYPFSRESPQPRCWTGVSCIAGRFFTDWAITESQSTDAVSRKKWYFP